MIENSNVKRERDRKIRKNHNTKSFERERRRFWGWRHSDTLARCLQGEEEKGVKWRWV